MLAAVDRGLERDLEVREVTAAFVAPLGGDALDRFARGRFAFDRRDLEFRVAGEHDRVDLRLEAAGRQRRILGDTRVRAHRAPVDEVAEPRRLAGDDEAEPAFAVEHQERVVAECERRRLDVVTDRDRRDRLAVRVEDRRARGHPRRRRHLIGPPLARDQDVRAEQLAAEHVALVFPAVGLRGRWRDRVVARPIPDRIADHHERVIGRGDQRVIVGSRDRALQLRSERIALVAGAHARRFDADHARRGRRGTLRARAIFVTAHAVRPAHDDALLGGDQRDVRREAHRVAGRRSRPGGLGLRGRCRRDGLLRRDRDHRCGCRRRRRRWCRIATDSDQRDRNQDRPDHGGGEVWASAFHLQATPEDFALFRVC